MSTESLKSSFHGPKPGRSMFFISLPFEMYLLALVAKIILRGLQKWLLQKRN